MPDNETAGNQAPLPSNDNKEPRGCLPLLGNLQGQTHIKILGNEFEAPLGVVAVMFVSILVAYVAVLLWVIPHQVPFLSDPLIEAALTAQPPQPLPPRIVPVGKRIQNTQYCVELDETVPLKLVPEPGPSALEYIWVCSDATGRRELNSHPVTGYLEYKVDVDDKEAIGNVVTITLYEIDPFGRDRPISDARFLVQEKCK